ncbi:sensor histidine kinase [Pseudomonas viridiflava]|uniref:sensor histidine kinase n=1 Tax=Pseudomonas viridiflava TaxID=33069 RepID=UPI000F0383B9|nr:sensor histidine kinase [Pseudomonas viridiflava]
MELDSEGRTAMGWGNVAFIARCARRFADMFAEDQAEPAAARIAVSEAIQLAEARAALGGSRYFEEALQLNGKFFDPYDIKSVHGALHEYAEAASHTHEDLAADVGVEPIARRTYVALRLARIALEAAFPDCILLEENVSLDSTVDWVLFGEPQLRQDIDADLVRLEAISNSNGAEQGIGVSPVEFGPLWSRGWPSYWPSLRLKFRPRARIIRTIGDRLISGPEAAVIELVKNSYDADASMVRITFLPSLQNELGSILFEDDGHGMTLQDIQEKWMEPATSDKKLRKESPRGRNLLGSKGIGRFAAARLGRRLQLTSVAKLNSFSEHDVFEKTIIPSLDWDVFEQTRYLDDVSFAVETSVTTGPSGTQLLISSLRDTWAEASVIRLYHELRRLVSPVDSGAEKTFRIFLDVSNCTIAECGFDGAALFELSGKNDNTYCEPYEVKPFPMLDACDYAVDGIFDENGVFDGTMTIRIAGMESEPIKLSVPLKEGEDPCGVCFVQLSIFDREAESIRSTAKKAGFGHLGVRDARKLLDGVAGIAIYREGFRIRPYGDGENDWLTLDAKRVQNPTMKIGRNQVAGSVNIDDENASQLLERSSREGLEENGSFRRLQSLILTLLAEIVEPRRRNYRFASGLEKRKQSGFRDVIGQAELSWARPIIEKLPEKERPEAQKLLNRESGRLITQLKELDERQAKLEAQVTLGSIIGEVMHQGNTPLAFIETEVARLQQWWPSLFENTQDSIEDRADVPKILNGMSVSAALLRVLFKALSPLAGASRGEPQTYRVREVLDETLYLFASKAVAAGVRFNIDPKISELSVIGYHQDLATALTNLVDNAIHWLSYHSIVLPKLDFTVDDTASDKVKIFVHDNGNGVPEEYKGELFDVGFTRKLNGTGLGLSIAREAIYRSAGELYLVDSEVGAKFAITLPRN